MAPWRPISRMFVKGWTEEQIIKYDKMALENHMYRPTRSERSRHSVNWRLSLNQAGPQEPLNQRHDFAQAKRECKRLHDEYMEKRLNKKYRTIPCDQQVRQRRGQEFEGHEEYFYHVDPRTGWRFYEESQDNLSPSSSSTACAPDPCSWRSWRAWAHNLCFVGDVDFVIPPLRRVSSQWKCGS